jgi:hypothetical protein
MHARICTNDFKIYGLSSTTRMFRFFIVSTRSKVFCLY